MEEFIAKLRAAYRILQARKRHEFGRHVPFADLISERSEIAASYGFGEGTTCYDNIIILGDVKVGRHTWIGPNVILDGRGGLEIGDHVSISAGVHIYTHDSVAWSTSRGVEPMPHSRTTIGSGVYIGPNAVIQRGVEIGEGAVIGALSYVDIPVPAGRKAWGIPARLID